MKKLTLLAGGLLITGLSFGQGTELFFSEYFEGAGAGNNDKGVEIFNPTSTSVDIRAYSVRRYSNGSSTVTEDERMMPDNPSNFMVASQDVYVYANPEADAPAILSAKDQTSSPYGCFGPGCPNVILTGGAANANGNDVYTLVRWIGGTPGTAGATPVTIDIFGKIGEDPGVNPGWAGVQTGAVTTISSANHTLVRKPDVSGGVTDENAPFDITQEWYAYSRYDANATPPQDFSRLGEHADYTGPVGNYVLGADLLMFDQSISMYPNPARGNFTIRTAENNVGSIALFNGLGQQIKTQNNTFGNEINVNISNLSAGVYFVKFISQNGQMAIYKELIVQ